MSKPSRVSHVLLCPINWPDSSTREEVEDQVNKAEAATRYLLCLLEVVAWYSGGVYDGHTLSRKEEGWLLVVRVRLDGRPMVAFSFGARPADAVGQFARSLARGSVQWRPDKYS